MESTPARAARTIPSSPWAWAAIGRFHRWASSTAAASSSSVSETKSRVTPGVRTPPVATTLIEAGARPDLPANPRPEALAPVDLLGEGVPAVAPGDRERAAAGDDPRARDAALLDRAAHVDGDRAHRAEVADGRDAAGEMPLRVARCLDRRRRLGHPALGQEVRLAVEAQVHVAVEQARREERALGVEDGRLPGLLVPGRGRRPTRTGSPRSAPPLAPGLRSGAVEEVDGPA